jgi:hypothetical protein
MIEHELWSFNNALFVVILFVIIAFIINFGMSRIFDIRNIKKNWATERCKPLIMPFAGLFGYNAKENFDFCLGQVFNAHSTPYFGSMGILLANFTNVLQMVFDSVNTLRNVIASLGGGINVIFQEFTERISFFFFKLRISAIQIRTLIGRMYAVMFSMLFMGLSGIAGLTSFTNTFLFSFLNVFCFPGDTELDVEGKGKLRIKDIKIGDILEPTKSKVTATFRFFARGQPMVKLGSTIVSTNHYVLYLGHPIKAGDHPEAIQLGSWDSDEPLYCLNTSDNHIPLDGFLFLDYDETPDGDKDTMNYIEGKVNACFIDKNYNFNEYCPALDENIKIKTIEGLKLAKHIKIGDKLTTGGEVVGLIKRKVTELCDVNGIILTPSTMIWNDKNNKWERIGDKVKINKKESELVSFIVVPNSQIELEDGSRIRDYMELCSPDSETYYSERLESMKTS